MEGYSIIAILVVGAIAGWLAGLVVQGGGFGLLGDIVVGIVGAFVAGFLFPSLHIQFGTPIITAIVDAAIGAIVLLLIIKLVRRVV